MSFHTPLHTSMPPPICHYRVHTKLTVAPSMFSPLNECSDKLIYSEQRRYFKLRHHLRRQLPLSQCWRSKLLWPSGSGFGLPEQQYPYNRHCEHHLSGFGHRSNHSNHEDFQRGFWKKIIHKNKLTPLRIIPYSSSFSVS
ncbi:hypothetical protein U1Q18_025088 [Sarracenia purpurea var. burkii]